MSKRDQHILHDQRRILSDRIAHLTRSVTTMRDHARQLTLAIERDEKQLTQLVAELDAVYFELGGKS